MEERIPGEPGRATADGAEATDPARIEALARELVELQLRHAGARVAKHDATPDFGENGALYQLERAGGALSPGEIAHRLGLTTGRTAALLGALESKGLVERRRRDDDRRQVSVTLTDAGSKRVSGLYGRAVSRRAELLGRLGEHDAGELVRILGRVFDVVPTLGSCDGAGRRGEPPSP